MTTPNTNPSDLDRAARNLDDKIMDFLARMENDLDVVLFDDIVLPALNQLRAALALPRASGVPEAEAVRLRREAFMAGVAWQKEMEAPPVAALIGEAVASKLGKWMSAALDDPNVCAEMKADIEAWFKSGEPSPPSPIASEPKDASLRAVAKASKTFPSASEPKNGESAEWQLSQAEIVSRYTMELIAMGCAEEEANSIKRRVEAVLKGITRTAPSGAKP